MSASEHLGEGEGLDWEAASGEHRREGSPVARAWSFEATKEGREYTEKAHAVLLHGRILWGSSRIPVIFTTYSNKKYKKKRSKKILRLGLSLVIPEALGLFLFFWATFRVS